MVNLSETATLLEIAWTVAAAPGFILWLANFNRAYSTVRLAKQYGASEDRMLWARFSVLLTSVFLVVESVFLFLGGISMLREQSPYAMPLTTYILGSGLILASLLIGFVGYRWRVVDRTLVDMARNRKAVPGR